MASLVKGEDVEIVWFLSEFGEEFVISTYMLCETCNSVPFVQYRNVR